MHGGYNLYEGSREKQVSVFYFDSKEKPKRISVNPRGVETQMKVYFGSCAEKTKAKLLYNKVHLERYFKAMNACAYPGQIPQVQKEKTLRPKFSLGIMAGYYLQPVPKFTFVSSKLFENAHFSNANHATFGMSANFNLNTALGFSAGVNYVDKSLLSDSLNSFGGKICQAINPNTGEPIPAYLGFFYRHVFSLRMQHLEIPIGVRFRPKSYNKSGPVVVGGLTFSFPLTAKFEKSWGLPYRVESPSYLTPTPSLEEGLWEAGKLQFNTPILGVYAGLGWRRQLNKKK